MPRKDSSSSHPEVTQAGWKLNTYCKLVDYSRAFYFTLPEELRPRSVKVGKRRIIIEPPREYLERLATAQQKGGAA